MEPQFLKSQELQAIIGKYIDSDQKIIDKQISKFTTPGENFGSIILKIDLTLENDKRKRSKLNVIAKLMPTVEFLKKVFNVQVTFQVEAAFYSTIIPALQKFQHNMGVQDVLDFFPKFYGARIYFDNHGRLDTSTMILLENLKVAGYSNVDRHEGCDFETAKLILRNLAQFHAVPLALKMANPRLFEETIKKNMACSYPTPEPIDRTKPNAIIEEILNENEECVNLIPKVVDSDLLSRVPNMVVKEPYATITHQDLWINNVMVKIKEGQLVSSKIVDFQMCTYDSPVKDVLFFIFTSVEFNVLEHHVDFFLEYYYENFQKSLESLGCPLELFPPDIFVEEIYRLGIYEIYHILFIYLLIQNGNKYGNTTPKNALGPGVPALPKASEIALETKQKAWWILQEFERRGWLM